MKLTIVYDNEVFRKGLKSGFGFSAYIESDDKKILFDTGWDGSDLLHNMRALDINPGEIDIIVLSHQHWDHIGGLNHVLNEAGNVNVYTPASFSKNLKNEIKSKANLIEVSNQREIVEGVYTTGELTGSFRSTDIMEQSLVVDTSRGLFVVVGCSHPGLEIILEKASEFGRVYGVVGGFHGFNKYDTLKNLKFIVPTHCTQHKKEIKGRYIGKVEDGGAGWTKNI